MLKDLISCSKEIYKLGLRITVIYFILSSIYMKDNTSGKNECNMLNFVLVSRDFFKVTRGEYVVYFLIYIYRLFYFSLFIHCNTLLDM